jgi:hypothetical protein
MPMRNRPGARRPWIHGLVAAILAVLFVGTGAIDAYGLHRCPHHDALPGDGYQQAEGSHGDESHAAAHAAGAGGGAAAGAQGEQGHDEHGPCSCIGLCGAASTAMPGAASATPRLALVTFDAPAARPAHTRADARTDYLLPFANAPPFVR